MGTERGVMLLLPVIEKETLIIVLCSLAACLRKKYVHGDERLAGCVFASRPNFSMLLIPSTDLQLERGPVAEQQPPPAETSFLVSMLLIPSTDLQLERCWLPPC